MTSSTIQFNTTGDYYWRAFFDGTGLNNDSISPCNEVLTVRQNTSVATVLHERTNATGDTDVTPANDGLTITVNNGALRERRGHGHADHGHGHHPASRYYGTLEACEADTAGAAGTAAGSGTVTNGSSDLEHHPVQHHGRLLLASVLRRHRPEQRLDQPCATRSSPSARTRRSPPCSTSAPTRPATPT